MPRDMFGNVTRPSISIGNRKWYTLPLSLVSHSAIVLFLIAIPILAPSAMPSVFAEDDTGWIRIEPPPPPPPPQIRSAEDPPPPMDGHAAPVIAPEGIVDQPPRHDPAGPEVVSIITGDPDALVHVLAEPPPAPKPVAPVPVRVGTVRAPQKLNSVSPVYPPIALAGRIQGIVIIEATIAEDGHVTDARVLRSVPLLDQAAIDAVRQWLYTPTMLNGVPVPVIMTVTVSFTLK